MLKMTTARKPALILAMVAGVSLLASACVSITEAKGPYQAGQATYQLNRSWNDVSQATFQTKEVKLLTLDGPVLNSLYLSQGLKEGQFLVRPEHRREKTTPAWRADMSILEQVEFVTGSVEALGYVRVAASQPLPVQVAGQRGVRFGLTAARETGLEIKGYGQVVVRDQLAYVAIYLAPSEHYFAETEASVTSTLDSLTF